MRLALVVAIACGCFHPSPPAGAPCSTNNECPGDQLCDLRLSPPTCVDSLTPDNDSGVDADRSDGTIGVDAPPAGACIADSDCTDGICHELMGTCVPDAQVLFVATSGQGTACTRMAPCGTLQTAIDARTQTRYTVALAAGTYSSSFDTTAMSNGASKLVISGPTRSPDDAVLTSSALNRVYVQLTAVFEGLTIRGGGAGSDSGITSRGTTTLSRVKIDLATDDGVVCAEGTLKIFDSKITNSTNTGVYASGGTVRIERTQLVSNGTYGVHIDGASYTIVNSIMASNGTAFAQSGGARLRGGLGGGAVSVFRFNTLARNQGVMYASLNCDNTATISNTIFGEQSLIFPMVSPSCAVTYSLFNSSAGTTPAGTGNISGDPMFVSASDFHLQMGSPAIDKANPTGAEPIDIDGQQRISPPDIGADEHP